MELKKEIIKVKRIKERINYLDSFWANKPFLFKGSTVNSRIKAKTLTCKLQFQFNTMNKYNWSKIKEERKHTKVILREEGRKEWRVWTQDSNEFLQHTKLMLQQIWKSYMTWLATLFPCFGIWNSDLVGISPLSWYFLIYFWCDN